MPGDLDVTQTGIILPFAKAKRGRSGMGCLRGTGIPGMALQRRDESARPVQRNQPHAKRFERGHGVGRYHLRTASVKTAAGHQQRQQLRSAVYGLRNRNSVHCAAGRLNRLQITLIISTVVIWTWAAFEQPAAAGLALIIVCTLPFTLIILYRLAALVIYALHPYIGELSKSQHTNQLSPASGTALRAAPIGNSTVGGSRTGCSKVGFSPADGPCADIRALRTPVDVSVRHPAQMASSIVAHPHPWPSYIVLVPLFSEVESIYGLVASLSQLDYPADQLDIIFIVEQCDHATQTALARAKLSPHMRTCVVPDGQPRTKPRALNYALQLAHGQFVVVYDAESISVDDRMRLVRETRLSECAYIVPSEQADFGARYYLTHAEIPLAGHPTIAT
ncbi:MAG: glycosyltransferase, partial [Pseudomonadota bacterium]